MLYGRARQQCTVSNAMQQCLVILYNRNTELEIMEQYDGGIVSQLGLGASFVSIFGSLYIYFVSEDQSLGIFVGLWAPTLILISREIDKMLGWMSK